MSSESERLAVRVMEIGVQGECRVSAGPVSGLNAGSVMCSFECKVSCVSNG